jgi:GNAT superfamily N-acetyltransferase
VYANIGKASCANCHNGALLTDNSFHNTGVPLPATSLPPDSGRIVGVRQARAGEFSCIGRYSDARPDDCQELRFAVTDGEELVRAYKTPSLRMVAERAPYMHAGQLASLGAAFALPERERYLWNFVTLPAHRGRGIYPRLLAAIVDPVLEVRARRTGGDVLPRRELSVRLPASGAGMRRLELDLSAQLHHAARGQSEEVGR